MAQNSLRSFDISVLVKCCWEHRWGQVLHRWPYRPHGRNKNTMPLSPHVHKRPYTQCTRYNLHVVILRNALRVQVLVSAYVFYIFFLHSCVRANINFKCAGILFNYMGLYVYKLSALHWRSEKCAWSRHFCYFCVISCLLVFCFKGTHSKV
jgi:hypothetical protein